MLDVGEFAEVVLLGRFCDLHWAGFTCEHLLVYHHYPVDRETSQLYSLHPADLSPGFLHHHRHQLMVKSSPKLAPRSGL